MGIVKVNRTNRQVKIYEAVDATKQIGTLYPNEMFTWIEEWTGSAASDYYMQRICFRNKAGEPYWGWVALAQNENVLATNICALPYCKKVINGKTYYGFKMRRTEELYDGSANLISKKAYAGRILLCESSTSGKVNTHWLACQYLETAVGSDRYAEIISGKDAFVDLGYDQGSTFTTNCSLIGSL